MTEATQDILVHSEAGVTTITFNRVDKKNSITRGMYAAMADTLDAAKADASVRVVVFQGDVAIFSAATTLATFCSSRPPRRTRPYSVFCAASPPFPSP